MKGLVFYGLVFCTMLSSTAFAQEFEVPITVSDNAHSAVLTIGVHLNGTDGFDAGLDIFAPPPPPGGSFDARSVINGESFITDIRDNATTEKIFQIRYDPASGQGPIVLTWDPASLSTLGNFFITDDITGELFGPLDMTTTDRLDISTAGEFLDDRLLVLVTPASSQENNAPVALNDEATTDEDTALDIDVLANDTDPDGDMLTLTQVSDPPNGAASINADGTVRYIPEADVHGTDDLTYTVSDPGGLTAQGTVSVTITPVNDAPVFTSTPVTEATLNTSFSYAIAATDVDGDALTVTAPTRPTWLAFVDHGDGTAILEGTPAQADAGPHNVLLEVTDGVETTQQALTIMVTVAMNLPPSATTPTIPADGTTVQLEGDPQADFVVEWNAASDPEGAVVSYRWELSLTQSFSTLLFNEDVGTTTRFETTVGAVATALTRAGIPVGSALTVFHRVVTSDGMNETVGSVFTVTLVRGVLVGVEAEALPGRFALLGNYPNPFNPETVIRYALAEPASVHLAVYDALGRQVAVLVDEAQQAGYHERAFNASSLRSGTYFYRLKAKHFHQVRGMILMK